MTDKPQPAEGSRTIRVVTTAAPSLRGSGMRGVEEQARTLVEKAVSVEVLNRNLGTFLDSLRQLASIEEARVGDFVLEEIAFSAEISAEGEFKLLGTGAGISAKSGINFTLKRQPAGGKE